MNLTLDKDCTTEVTTLAEASKQVDAYLRRAGLGYTEWYGRMPRGAEVREGRKLVALVSYNGRVWNPDNKSEILP